MGDKMAKKLFGGKETYSEELAEAKAIKSGKITPEQYAKSEGKEEKAEDKGMKCGGKVKKMASGGVCRGAGAASRGIKFKGVM